MQDRLKIINLNVAQDGCSYVRHSLPFEALRDLGHYVQMKFPIFRNDFNVAVLSRAQSQDLTKIILKMKALGTKIVYDTDDLLFELEPENPYSSHKDNIKGSALAKQSIQFVDLVTCTTPTLAVELTKFTKAPIRVLPNCINPKHWKDRPRAVRNAVRIGYTGSISHLKELLFLIPIIRDLKKKYDIEFHLFGIFDSLKSLENDCNIKAPGNPVWQKLGKQVLKDLAKLEYVHHSFVSIDQYPAELSAMDLDIGLCPLFNSRFNDCKSNIKYLEYAMAGTAPLCADSPAYSDCPNAAEMDQRLWTAYLENMIVDKAYREAIADESKEFALEFYQIKNRIHEWEEVYFTAKQNRPTIQRNASLAPQGIGQKELVHA